MKKPLTRLDLNLLHTLQLLAQERSVSKTAKRLNVTPSTVSKSLKKLRDWFDDPLFINTPKGLIPTPLSLSMEQDLADWLQISAQILEKQSDHSSKSVQFDLTVESPLLLTELNELVTKIHQCYPQASIKTSRWDYDSLDALISGDIDIALTGKESHPNSKESLDLLPYFIDYEVIFTDLPVVYLREDHPALEQSWDLQAFISYAHINTVWEKRESWALDSILNEQGISRRVDLTMSSFEQSLFMTAQPNHTMLTVAPAYCEKYTKQLHPNLVSLPIPLTKSQQDKLLIPLTLLWHKRNNYNPKIQWLREAMKSLYHNQG